MKNTKTLAKAALESLLAIALAAMIGCGKKGDAAETEQTQENETNIVENNTETQEQAEQESGDLEVVESVTIGGNGEVIEENNSDTASGNSGSQNNGGNSGSTNTGSGNTSGGSTSGGGNTSGSGNTSGGGTASESGDSETGSEGNVDPEIDEYAEGTGGF